MNKQEMLRTEIIDTINPDTEKCPVCGEWIETGKMVIIGSGKVSPSHDFKGCPRCTAYAQKHGYMPESVYRYINELDSDIVEELGQMDTSIGRFISGK